MITRIVNIYQCNQNSVKYFIVKFIDLWSKLGGADVVIAQPHLKYKSIMQFYIIAASENHKKLYMYNFYFLKYTFSYKLQV